MSLWSDLGNVSWGDLGNGLEKLGNVYATVEGSKRQNAELDLQREAEEQARQINTPDHESNENADPSKPSGRTDSEVSTLGIDPKTQKALLFGGLGIAGVGLLIYALK